MQMISSTVKVFAVLLLVLFVLCGCGKDEVRLPGADYTVSFTEEYLKLNGNSLKLIYPTVSEYSDTSIETAVNMQSALIARQFYEQAGLIALDEGGYTYTATEAEVTLATMNFFSVYITGIITSDVTGEADGFVYTLNCDLKNGVFLSTEDIISDYPALFKAFKNSDFTADINTDGIFENFTLDSLISQYRTEYGIYPSVYFREGKLGIITETLPAFGTFTGFTADIRDALNWLDTDNPIIAFLCGIKNEDNFTETE